MIRNLINGFLAPILKKLGLSRQIFILIHNFKQNVADSRKLKLKAFKTVNIPKEINKTLPLICIFKNESNLTYLNHFLNYYRNLGVSVFYLFLEGDIAENILDKSDCYIQQIPKINGTLTVKLYNEIVKKYIPKDNWYLLIPPNCLIIYPLIESRNLLELVDYLDNLEEPLLFTTTVDLYGTAIDYKASFNSNKKLFESFKFFDRYNFIQKFDKTTKSYKIYGGPNSRLGNKLFPERLENLNRGSVVKNIKGMKFFEENSITLLNDYNNTLKRESRAMNGVLFRIVLDPNVVLGDSNEASIYSPYWSIEYKQSTQLEELKIMQRGEWF